MSPAIPGMLRKALPALSAAFIPETALATPQQERELAARITQALAARPPALRRQLALFVALLEVAALLRYGRRLPTLRPAQLDALLHAFATTRMLLFRRGIWGLRTLVMLGWYTQPSVTQALGYRASPAGWDARR